LRWKLAVAALATSWGLIAVIVRKIDLDAQVLAFYRLAFAAATLVLVAVALRRLVLLRLTRHRGGVLLIGVTLAAHWFLYFVTIKLSSVAALVLMTKRIVSDVPVLTLSFSNYAIAAVAISPLLLDADRVLPTANELPAVLALGVAFTALSGYVYIWSLRHVTAQTIGILAYIEPVSAALMAWAFLGESLDWQIVVGGALVIAAGATVVFLEPADAATPEVVPLGSRS